MHFDLIVIGAGPAGCAAAERAAAGGMKVLLLEKQKLPRHKTCGGGMPMLIGDEFPSLPREGVVECDVTHMRHTFRFENEMLAPMNRPDDDRKLSLWMVQRSLFDNALASLAASAGADVRDASPVRALELNGRVEVRTESDLYTSDLVIGADGANGMSARAVGLRKNRALAVGMEIEYPFDWSRSPHKELRPEVVHLEYGAVPQGYAWIFPKGDHLNVGAGVFRPRKEGRGDSSIPNELRATIHGYLELLSLPAVEGLRYHAHPIPVYDGYERLATEDGRVMLVGDAAGLVNPLFGDGILSGIKSGRLAGDLAVAGRANEYDRQLRDTIGKNFDTARQMAKIFYGWPEMVYKKAISRPSSTRSAALLFCGEKPFDGVWKKVRRQFAGL